MTPQAKREAARHAIEQCGLSERRACGLVAIQRSTYRYRSRRQDWPQLRERLKQLAYQRRRFGYRRLWAMLRREGWPVNRKRVYRLYKQENLALRRTRSKRRRPSRTLGPTAVWPNVRWALDFMSDTLASGRKFRTFNVLEECTRECLAIEVDTSLGAVRVIRVLEQVIAERGKPHRLLMDNGPEFTSTTVAEWAANQGIRLEFIEPGQPNQNPHIESFNGKFRDECLNEEWFMSLHQARYKIEQWRMDYNQERPHSSLDQMSPAEFAAWGLANRYSQCPEATLGVLEFSPKLSEFLGQ